MQTYPEVIGPSLARAPRLTRGDRKIGTTGMVRASRLDTWRNVGTTLTPSGLAQAYIESMPLDLRSSARGVMRAWVESPSLGKAEYKKVPLSEFSDKESCAAWLQFGALFLKSAEGSKSADRKERAFASFLKANARCKRYTRKLRWFKEHPSRMPDGYLSIIRDAQRTISSLLGEWNVAAYMECIRKARPGSGTAIGSRDRDCVSPPFKYGYTDLVSTGRALIHADLLVRGSPVWTDCVQVERGQEPLEYRVVDCDRITTVPKDAETDRTIGIGPALNVALQLGVHEYVYPRMKRRWGVDLENQSNNSSAAQKASERWSHLDPDVTLDVKDSSNTNSVGMVELLMPDGWLDYLRETRSPCFQLDGKGPGHDYWMWSCMGNGYTFVLQCMMYYALAVAVTRATHASVDRVRIYGDDIIVPRQAALLLTEILGWLGVGLNLDKSHLFGPFRESCGGEYFAGLRVTPTYLRGVKQLRLVDVYKVANRLRGGYDALRARDDALSTMLLACLQGSGPHPLVPQFLESEAGLWSTSYRAWWHRYEQGWYGLTVSSRTVSAVPHEARWSYAAALRGARELEFHEELGLSQRRGRVVYTLVARRLIGRGGVGG